MSEASSETADVEQALDEIADELYGLRPDAFSAARDEQIRKARAERRQPLARELGRLRKPTQSAWLINLLWRDQREVMEQYLQLAEDLSMAQAQASGPELLRLTAVRRELEAALVRAARALAEKAGVSVTASMEREAQETLSAALARTDVADEIRTGRLVKPAEYAGFGTLLPSTPSPATPARVSGEDREPTRIDAPRTPKRDDDREASRGASQSGEREARAAERARERREAAERGLEDARAVFEAAATTLAEQVSTADAADQEHQALRQQADEAQTELRELQQRQRQLQERLRTLQSDVLTAEQAATSAAARKRQAEKTHEAAVRTLARAEMELKDATAAG